MNVGLEVTSARYRMRPRRGSGDVPAEAIRGSRHSGVRMNPADSRTKFVSSAVTFRAVRFREERAKATLSPN